MTAAQKAAKQKFKKAIEYRTKTGVSLKEAFAHVYGKKVGAVKKKAAPKKKAAVKKAAPKKAAPKKAAPKKVTSSHKDTKSHNVNIRVVSGSVGELSKSLVKKLNEIINEIEQREDVIVDVMGRKKQLIEKNGIQWYKKWISDAKKIVSELKKHKTELKKLI